MRKNLDDLLEKKQKDFYNSMNNINTFALAKILELNNSILEASIELISYMEFKGSYVENPVIHCVPIMPLFNSSAFFINCPYNVGDLIVVGCCQHSLEGTIDKAEQVEPLSKDRYSIDDAIILGNITTQYTDPYPEDLSIIHKKTGNHIRFTQDGIIEIYGDTKIYGNLEVNGIGNFSGVLESSEDVKSNGISLVNHKHGDVQPGSAETGVPK